MLHKFIDSKRYEAMRILAALWLMVGGACAPGESDLVFDGQQAWLHVQYQLSLGPRHPGTPGHEAVADWIGETLQQEGWERNEQTFQYRGVALRNIIGSAGPLDAELIILGAHYDTRPAADRDAENPQAPVPGANDGASGVAVLLELARTIRPEELGCRVEMVFFDAEDSGGLDGWDWIVGSLHYAGLLETAPAAVVVVDMVGDRDLQIFQEGNSSPALTAEIWQLASDLGHQAFIPEVGSSILDDHIPFVRIGLEAIDIIDFDYAYWHTTEDTLDKVSADSLMQVGDTLHTWLSMCR
jgi:glutaminyl-peptide cyclotransferase